MKLNEYFSWANDLGNREIGIEVEVEGNYLPDHINGWNIKGDGSLRGNGLEYILPQPVGRNVYEKRINLLYDTFHKPPFSINPSDRCGVHIHLNCRELEFEQIFNFIVLYLICEDLLMHWCGDEREGNSFCLRAKDAEWLIYQLINDKKNHSFNYSTNMETFKYASINIAALRRYGSLEFRGLGTPITAKPIINWINILLALKDYAISCERSSDLISDVCIKTPKTYLREIIGNDLFNVIKCPNMAEMLIEGARRIQALAYTPLGKYKKKERLQGNLLMVNGSWDALPTNWTTILQQEEELERQARLVEEINEDI